MWLTEEQVGHSKDKMKHIERNDQLLVTRMMLIDNSKWQEMKNKCYKEEEQRIVHLH